MVVLLYGVLHLFLAFIFRIIILCILIIGLSALLVLVSTSLIILGHVLLPAIVLLFRW